MTPSRRNFVASLVGVPLVLQSASAQQRTPGNTTFVDPVLDQIMSDLRSLAAEFESQPSSQKATMRAMESTLGIQAAHMAVHYDPSLLARVRRRRTRIGRALFVQEIVTMAHDNRNHDLSYDRVDAALTRLEQRGLAGTLRDMQQAMKKLRQNLPDQFKAVTIRPAQYDYCSDLRWVIEIAEAAVAIACGIAIMEPSPAGEAACGAMTLALGIYYAQRAFWC